MTANTEILLFGATGQVGWELRRTLEPLGDIVAPGRDEVDFESPTDAGEFVLTNEPDLVVNAAAFTDVDGAEDRPEVARRVNAEAPGEIAVACAELGVPLVHYSTDYVFDGELERPYREDDETNPLGVYGRTKLAGEEAIRQHAEQWLILRTSWIYSLRRSNFLRTMLGLSEEHDVIEVVDDEFGAPTRARSIAEATAQAVGIWRRESWTENLGGLYHATANGSTSWYGFSKAIFEHWLPLNADSVTVEPIASAAYETKAERPKNTILSCRKFAENFGLELSNWSTALELLAKSF